MLNLKMPVIDDNAMLSKLEEIADLLRALVAKEQQRPRRLMRLKESASYLCISPWQLRRLIQAGELAVIRQSECGHAPFLLDKADLDSWVERVKVNVR